MKSAETGSTVVLKINGKVIAKAENVTFTIDPENILTQKVCECGADKLGLPGHLNYCEKRS